MSHLFKFPRKIDPAVKERYDLLRKHGKSRKAAVDFICGIGGYSDRWNRWPIEFNVKMYPDLDADTLWPICRDKCDFGILTWTPAEQVLAESVFREQHKQHEDSLWNWAQEDMVRSAKDDDWFYMDWLGGEDRFEWSLVGRGGGHLVLDYAAFTTLKGKSEEDLYDELMEPGEGGRGFAVDISVVKCLLVVCIELTSMCNRQWLEDECQYKAAWTLWANICEPEYDRAKRDASNRESLTEGAELIRDLISGKVVVEDGGDADAVTAFTTICQLAGIQLKE